MSINIGIIGGHKCTKRIAKIAEELGRLIAKQGWVAVCGGGSGVMEAVCRGVKQESGISIGILPTPDKSIANKYLTVALPTGIGYARNFFVVRASDILIAVGGSYGTLSEIAFALSEGKEVIGIYSWDIKGVKKVQSPADAVRHIKRKAVLYEQ